MIESISALSFIIVADCQSHYVMTLNLRFNLFDYKGDEIEEGISKAICQVNIRAFFIWCGCITNDTG